MTNCKVKQTYIVPKYKWFWEHIGETIVESPLLAQAIKQIANCIQWKAK